MPGPFHASRPRRRKSPTTPAAAPVRTRALLVIDNRPLQRAAWAAFHAARKRFEKVSRDLHRHEQIDQPQYESWMHRMFPVLVTTFRDLLREVTIKEQRVQSVIAISALTGRPAKKIWREEREYEADPEAFDARAKARDKAAAGRAGRDAPPDDDLFGKNNSSDTHNTSSRPPWEDDDDDFFGLLGSASPTTPAQSDIRDTYRRLVQHLHPDRGGEWTPAREHLWHEVQQAWAARDADWLSRLEVEWETANEILTPTSPLSRLHRAIEELHAARRDTERKLRAYRRAPAWRFSLSEKVRDHLLIRVEVNFKHDIKILQTQLAYLNSTIAAWEAAPRAKKRASSLDRRHSR